jgi:hypothetical protein
MTPSPSSPVQTVPSAPATGRSALLAHPFPHAGYLWRGLENQGHRRSLLGGLVLMVLAVLLVPRFAPVSVGFMLGQVCGFSAFLLWWAQVEGLMQQNRPVLARLVPGHVVALRRSLRNQWLLHTAGWTLVCAAATQWQHAPFIACGVGLALFALVWLVRQPWLWLLAGVAFPTLVMQHRAVRAAAHAVATDLPAALPWMAVLLVSLAALVPLALQTGHARHRARAARRDRLRAISRAMSTGGSVPVRLQAGWLGGLQGVYALPWRWLLRISLRRGRRPVRMGRLNLVLAGSAHWAHQLAVLALLLPLFSVPLFMGAELGAPALNAMRFGLCIAVFGIALNPSLQLGCNLVSRRGEQGLLMLSPGVPQGAELAQRWQRFLALQFLLGWLLAAGVVLGPMLAFASQGTQSFCAGYAAGCLPLVTVAWRDWARLKGGGTGLLGPQGGFSLPLVTGMLSGGLCEILALPPAVSLGASLLLTAVLVGVARWRWQQAQRGRRNVSPWPVGRV